MADVAAKAQAAEAGVTGSCKAGSDGWKHMSRMHGRLLRPREFTREEIEKRMDELARLYHGTDLEEIDASCCSGTFCMAADCSTKV
jgi:hypothetical protein